jgi:hypothetical protein
MYNLSMDYTKLVSIDGVKWRVFSRVNATGKVKDEVEAICPVHSMVLTPSDSDVSVNVNGESTVRCSDGQYLYCDEGHMFTMPRIFSQERAYVRKRLEAVAYSKMETLNLDDEAIPIAKEKIKSDDNRYFITSQLMESKRGLQVVVYAGEKGKKQKTQIFIEPEVKRLAFDLKDLHPNEVFVEMKATFNDGSTQEINSSKCTKQL